MRPVLSLIMCMAAVGVAGAQPVRHDRIFVVPPPGPVTIDGDLEEWDLSAAVESAFDEALAPRFVFRAALMYDADALYIGCHLNDDTPLQNRHDPAVEPNVGWNGDAVQLRLCSDPAAPYPLPGSNSDRICHLTMWQYTDRSLPVLHLQYGMDYHGTRLFTGPDCGLCFRIDADGRGWTLEGRIPWERLNAAGSAPRSGDRIALCFQPLWSDASGWKQVMTYNEVIREAGFSFQGTGMWGQAVFLERGGLAPGARSVSLADQDRPLSISLPAPDPGAQSLSAAVFDASGVLVRTLPVVTDPRPVDGQVVCRWDGLDDDGKPLPPGTYTVKTLSHRGIGQRWVTSLHNAGNPPWRTDDGTGSWGGDHGPPVAAAADGHRVYLAWTVSEAGWAVIAVDKSFTPEGKPRKYWGQSQVLDIGICVMALAADGERVFVAQDGKGWGASDQSDNTAGVVIWDATTGRPVNFPFGQRCLVVSRWSDTLLPPARPFWEKLRDHDFGPAETGLNLTGIAVRDDLLYASLRLEHRVVAVNWKTGQRVREYPLPSPAGLAFTRDGTLLVVSDRHLVRLDTDTSAVTVAVTEGLSRPWGVAVGPEGRVYVSDCGAAMRVKVFDADLQPIGAIGNEGGRPWVGRYEPNGTLLPANLAVDADGKIWVPEYDVTPKRVSVWQPDGRLEADLLGGGAYAVEAAADETQPRWVNLHCTLFDVDYATGAAATVATLVRPNMHGPQFIPSGGCMGRSLAFRHVHGRTYLVWPGYHYSIVYLLGEDLVARLVAATGWLKDISHCGITREDLPADVRDAAWSNTFGHGFTWADRNGDHLVQPEEFVVERVDNAWGSYWGQWVDQDLTIWAPGRLREGEVLRVPVKEWLPGGVPVYPRPTEQHALFRIARGDQFPQVHYVMPGDDRVYVMEQAGGSTQTGQGAQFQAISAYRLDGTPLWSYRRVWLGFGLEAPLSRPGDVVGAMKLVGRARLSSGQELIAVNGYFGQFNLLSGEGLWVASLCKDNRYGPTADMTTVWPENFSGHFFRSPEDGKVYLIAGDTDARIWEVTGLDTIRTAAAELVISPEDRARAARVVAQRQGLNSELPPIVLTRTRQGAVCDGDLSDWDLGRATTVDTGDGATALAALAYDDERLWVAFRVPDSSPMRNTGHDPALLFKTGDACEVFLGTDPVAPGSRTRPVPGDVRLLFSEIDSQPVCVLYEPVVGVGERAPRMFSSPTGAEPFDRVLQLSSAQVAIQRSTEGYVLEAMVPLVELGLKPRPGTTLRGDVGVIFSDPGGSRNARRVDYANKETAIVNDIPSEARLQPSRWGLIQVE